MKCLVLSITLLVARTSSCAADLPAGKLTRYTYTQSKTFPGTTRDYRLYVPAQYETGKPACVMIFQDVGGFVKEGGPWRVSAVFDTLIDQGAMPVTIGIFIDPGITAAL